MNTAPMGYRRGLPLLLAVVLLASCSQGAAPATEIESGPVRVWIVGQGEGGADAQVGGTIRYLPDHQCFVAAGDDPEAGKAERDYYQPVLWPRNTTIVATNPPTLEVPGHGRLEVGDRIFGGGYSGAPPSDIDIPTACFGSEMGRDAIFLERIED